MRANTHTHVQTSFNPHAEIQYPFSLNKANSFAPAETCFIYAGERFLLDNIGPSISNFHLKR
jgi:hypothetical protein